MDDILKQKLKLRNNRIIEAIKLRAETLCPNSIALIAVVGSFCSGDYYEKSDLDLLIIINDNDGNKVSKCFILDDVAHDIYCHTWEQLEHMSEYNSPYIIKLQDVDIVYYSDESALEKYNRLKLKVNNTLNKPLDLEDFKKVENNYEVVLKKLGKLIIEENLSCCKYLSANLLMYIEFVLYMLNKTYIKVSVKRIPEEICKLRILPNNFNKLYFAIINANNLIDIKKTSTELVKEINNLLIKTKKDLLKKRVVKTEDICGTYEEIYSNWKNKMSYATLTGNKYLSFMTTASCQNFYDEMYSMYDMKELNLFINFDIDNLDKSEKNFNLILEKYLDLYRKTDTPVCYYNNIKEFEKSYLLNK